MKGSTILVTGASRVLAGECLASAIADGYKVLNFSRRPPDKLMPGEIFGSVDLSDPVRTREAITHWTAQTEILHPGQQCRDDRGRQNRGCLP